MFYAIANKDTKKLIEVTTAQFSYENGLQAYVKLNIKTIGFVTDEEVFIGYSNGVDYNITSEKYEKEYVDAFYKTVKATAFKTVAVAG